MPEEKGGLGIKKLKAFNIALLSKWRWKLMIGGKKLKALKHLVWIATVWGIWYARNKLI